MKKLLYLFFAITLLGCSSDDEDTTQTFLEKYEGIVWETEASITEPDYFHGVRFLNSPMTLIWNEKYNNFNDCLYYVFGEINQVDTDRAVQVTLIENSENTLVLKFVEKQVGEAEISTTTTITVIDEGNTIKMRSSGESSGDPAYIEFYIKSNASMSCN
jgi:hypothetical protein